MTKLFRGCRYEVIVNVPNRSLWSRHSSLKAAGRSFREAVNNRRGDHEAGTIVELMDVASWHGDGGLVIAKETVQS